MSKIFEVPVRWGHLTEAITPAAIVRGVTEETEQALHCYAALPEDPERCCDKDGYHRVSVMIPLASVLFDQLMNGATGYRAHYAVGIDVGEDFNRRLVNAAAPIIVSSVNLYRNSFGEVLCERSLLGPFSKFWFSKELTDPSGQTELLNYAEELCVPRWVEYWRDRPQPRKGLIAPHIPKALPSC